MEDKEKVDVGDKELYEKCAEETDTQFKQGYVELCKQNFKALNENEEWEDYADCAENASQEELERLKKENSKFYESCVKLTYYEQLDAQKKKENEQEAVQAAQDEEILNEMQEYFRGGIEEKRESAGELLEYIRMLDKQGVRKSGMGEGKSQAEFIPPRVVEMMLNNQIFEKEAKQLYHVLVKYGLYEATDKTWRTNLKKAR